MDQRLRTKYVSILALRRGALALVLGVALSGCRCDASGPAERGGPAAPSSAAVPVRPVLSTFALSEPSGYLPSDTAGVVFLRGLDVVLSWLGSDELARIEGWAPLPFTLSSLMFAVNPFDADAMTAAGLDIAAPAGLAGLDVDGKLGAAFFTLRDRDAFVSTTRRVCEGFLGGRVEEHISGDALVLEAYDMHGAYGWVAPTWIVLRGHVAFVVFGVAPTEQARAVVERLATVAPEQSLGRLAAYARAVESLDGEADAAVFVNVAAWTSRYLAGFESGARRDDLRETEGSRVNPEALAAQSARWQFDRPIFAGTSQTELLSLVLPIEAVLVRLRLESRAVDLSVHVVARNEALPTRLLRSGPPRPLVLDAMERAPLLLLHANTDPSVALPLVELVVGADRVRRLEPTVRNTLNRELTVLAELFDGEVSVSVRGQLEGLPLEELGAPAGWIRHFPAVVVLGLKDAAAARAIMAEAVSNPLTRLLVRYDAEHSTVAIPWIGVATVTVAVVGSHLVISTDDEVVPRLQRGDPAPWLVGSAAHSLPPPDAVAFAYADPTLLGLVAVTPFIAPREPNTVPVPDQPLPAEVIDALTRYADALRAQDEHRQAAHAAWFGSHVALFDALGPAVAVATLGPRGLVVSGGMGLREGAASVGAVVDRAVHTARAARLARVEAEGQASTMARQAAEALDEVLRRLREVPAQVP